MAGTVMTLAIVLALVAVRRRDFTSHGAWMTRAHAIGMGAGWVINAGVAECVIRRRATPARASAPSAFAHVNSAPHRAAYETLVRS